MNIDIERVFDYNIINTENITIVNQSRGDQRFLELSLPRLVYGEGSMIRIVIITASKIADYSNHNIHVTYDQGSTKTGPGGVENVLTPHNGYSKLLQNMALSSSVFGF